MDYLKKALPQLHKSSTYCSFKLSGTDHFLGYIDLITIDKGNIILDLFSKEKINGDPKEKLICFAEDILEVFPIFDDIEEVL